MNIGIIGLGLIGGSLGRAFIKFTPHKVYGSDIDDGAMLKADLLDAVSGFLTDEIIGGIDVLFVALSPSASIKAIENAVPKLKDGAIIVDVCGVKRIITAEMKRLETENPTLRFVGAHPMAGREFSGISHSSPTLFEKAYVIIVPVTNDIEALAAVKSLFLSVGSQDVEICSAERHDEMIAYTSQLAHIVSSSYIKSDLASCHAGFSAGSFRDMTRVAKLNPDMWAELFSDNRDNLTRRIDDLIIHLIEYRDAVASGDVNTLCALLTDGVKMKEEAENARKERLK